MKKLLALLSVGLLALTSAQAAVVASDDFESNSFTGGSGWASGWNFNNANNYVNSSLVIDGTYAMGVYGQNVSATRLVAPTISGSTDIVTLAWSLRANYDVTTDDGNGALLREIGVNVLSGSSSVLLTMKFAEGNSSLLLNDGGSDFARSGITFATNAIYDFTFSSAIGSGLYSFTAARRNDQSDSGNNFTYTGRTTGSIGGLQLFATAPTGAGNDGFLDSTSVSVVPEPTALALISGLGAMVMLRRRR